jgi:hypothetical protein
MEGAGGPNSFAMNPVGGEAELPFVLGCSI